MPGKPRRKTGAPEEMTPLEIEVMRILWQRETATASEVADAMPPERQLADTTIHTVLANLRRKGCIEPVPTIERAIRYAPTVEKRAVARRNLSKVLSDFFDGSPRSLIAHLVKEEKISNTELAELREMLEKAAKKGGKK